MPIRLDTAVFEEELLQLQRQLSRYLSDKEGWGQSNRSSWFISWYRSNQSWLMRSALERPLPQANPPREASPYERFGKSIISQLLTNYESSPWYKRFVWWFRLPMTKMYSLNAAYQLLDRLPAGQIRSVDVVGIKAAIGVHLLKIRPISSVFAYFKQVKERIETKIKYSPSNQLKIYFNEFLAELSNYGRKSKGFFSWQSHAEWVLELGLDNAQVRRRRQVELARIVNKTSSQRKELEVLYYVLLKESLEKCLPILSHPVPDKATQESLWSQAIGDLVAMMKRGSKELSGGSNPIVGLFQRMGRVFNELINESSIEVQIANYQDILRTSLRTELPAVASSIQAGDRNVKRLALTPTSLAICKRLGVEGVSDNSQEGVSDNSQEGVSDNSQEVVWENIRSRYKTLCQQHHPDRYQNQDEASRKAATERFQALQRDYKSLLDELEKGPGVEGDVEFDQEIREEYDRMNNFFDQFKQKLDGLNQDLKEFQQQSEAVSNKLDALIIRTQEQQKKQEEQQKKQEEQLRRREEQIKKEEEQRATLLQQSKRLEEITQSMIRKLQQDNPTVRLLRLTPERFEACIKLGLSGITQKSLVVSWNDIRTRYDQLAEAFSFDQLVTAPRQQTIDRFQELKATYESLLDELSKPEGGENRTNFDIEILKEREELDKLTVQFQSNLKRYEDAPVEEAQQASAPGMSP